MKKYEAPEIEIVTMAVEDVITTSIPDDTFDDSNTGEW